MKRLLIALVCTLLYASAAAAQTTSFNGTVADLTGAAVPTGQVNFTLKPGIDTTISGNSRFVSTTITCEIHNPNIVSFSINGGGVGSVTVATPQNWQVGDKLVTNKLTLTSGTFPGATATNPLTITLVNSTTSFNFSGPAFGLGLANGGTVGGLFQSGGTGACAVTQNTALNPANTSYAVSLLPIFSLSSTFNTYAIGSGPVDISTIVPTPGQQPAYSFVDTFSNQTITGQKTFLNGMTVTGGTFTSPTINLATFGASTWNSPVINTPTITNPTFTTPSLVLGGFANPYNVTWSNPGAPRSLTITDPGGNDGFVFLNAAQVVNNKSFSLALFQNSPTFSVLVATSVNGLAGLAGNFGPPFVNIFFSPDQIGAITTTTLLTAGLPSFPAYGVSTNSICYKLNYEIITSVAGTGTTATLTLSWTDLAAQSFTTPTINLNVLGSLQNGAIQPLCTQSGQNIQYATTVGAIGTSKYRVRLFLEVI